MADIIRLFKEPESVKINLTYKCEEQGLGLAFI